MFEDVPEDVLEEWIHFLDQPTQKQFLIIRDTIACSASYDPASCQIDLAESLLASGEVRHAAAQLRAAMPNWLLSPRIHAMASLAFRDEMDQQRADFERRVYLLLRQTLLESGEGTAEMPYRVLHSCDVDDLLEHLQQVPENQYIEDREGSRYMVCDCEAGQVFWFDMTAPSYRVRSLV